MKTPCSICGQPHEWLEMIADMLLCEDCMRSYLEEALADGRFPFGDDQ